MPLVPDYGYLGYAIVNGTTMMTQPGASVDRPRNITTPYPVGNRYGLCNYAEGVRFPVMRVPVIAMASYATAATINTLFHTRGGAAPYDVTALGTGVELATEGFADSRLLMTGVKGAGYVFNFRFGQNPIILQMEFHGTGFGVPAGVPAAVTTNQLTFAEVTFSGAAFGSKGGEAKGIVGGSITFSNSLEPNETLNGTHAPSTHNAGFPTAQLMIEMYADAGNLPPGYTDKDTYTEITDCGVHLKIAAAPTYTSWTFNKLILQNPNARQLMQGRGIRRLTYNAQTDGTAYPVTVAQT